MCTEYTVFANVFDLHFGCFDTKPPPRPGLEPAGFAAKTLSSIVPMGLPSLIPAVFTTCVFVTYPIFSAVDPVADGSLNIALRRISRQ